jgi:hypothetical protein
MAGIGQELDCREPFIVGRLDLLDGRMQMLGQNAKNFLQSWIRCVAHPRVDDVGRPLFLEIGNIVAWGDRLFSRHSCFLRFTSGAPF